jgi:hypothetical protein
MATNTFSIYGIASTETNTATGFTGSSGTQAARKSMPLADIAYTINIAFDGTGDIVTIPLSTGIATGDVVGVAATGTITFTGAPVANETITVRGVVYTFKATAATATEITIGGSVTATAANTVSKIVANDTLLDAANVAGVVTISASNTGEYGNAYTLAKSATNTAVSGATLTGGIDKVVITGDGVDFEGTALPTATKIHGLLVTCTAGSVTAAVSTILKDTVTPNGGLQTWNATGRTDLVASMTITSNAANTVAQVVVRASN